MVLLSKDWDLEEITSLRGYSVEARMDDALIVSRRADLFQTSPSELEQVDSETRLRRVGTFPVGSIRRAMARSRLAQRALRLMYYNVVPLNDRLFCSFAGSVALIGDGKQPELLALQRPTRILRGGCALTDDGSLFFGEYISNSDRTPIQVYRYRDDEAGGLEVAFEFGEGEIRHVHGIYWDPYTSSLWCACGDVGDECRILRFDKAFNLIEVVGSGDESWRAVSLLFTRDAVFYGMDAEFTQNFLYRIDRSDGRRTRIGEIEGPVYYSTANAGGLFFGVTAELCPSQSEPVASIWHVSDEGEATRIVKFRKDKLSPRYWMPGTIHFPRSDTLTSDLFFSTVAVEDDNRVYRLRPAGRAGMHAAA